MRMVARAQSVPRRLGFGEGLCLGLAVERVLGAFDDKQATEARSDRADAVDIDGGDAAFDVLDLVNVGTAASARCARTRQTPPCGWQSRLRCGVFVCRSAPTCAGVVQARPFAKLKRSFRLRDSP